MASYLSCGLQCILLVLLQQAIGGQFISPHFPQRAQRSLFGPPPSLSGWSPSIGHASHAPWSSGPSFHGFGGHLPPSHSPHVTKDELLALLSAWKDVEAPRPTTPAPEPEEEPEPETTAAPPVEEEEPEPEPEPEAPAPAPVPEAPVGPPPGVPVTVSLPALVPIQLAAMWQQPGPGAAVGGLGNLGLAGLGLPGGVALNNLGGGGGGGGVAAAGAIGVGAGAGAGRVAVRAGNPARPRARARIGGRASSAIRFPVANPRSFASGNYVAPRPRYYRDTSASMRLDVMGAPRPYQMTNVPGPVQLVPAYWQ
ncbi:hypothetical protein KR009_007147 [Drosophila setifemur]|nr:hypothetical protein KR009_007147 [Drosophila setifemur]